MPFSAPCYFEKPQPVRITLKWECVLVFSPTSTSNLQWDYMLENQQFPRTCKSNIGAHCLSWLMMKFFTRLQISQMNISLCRREVHCCNHHLFPENNIMCRRKICYSCLRYWNSTNMKLAKMSPNQLSFYLLQLGIILLTVKHTHTHTICNRQATSSKQN